MNRIKSLEINAFRGIPHLKIDLNSKNLLLTGENGTGKSSIINAIEFLFIGNIPTLTKSQSVSLKKHVTHLDYNNSDLSISIEFENNIKLSRTFSHFSKIPFEMKDFFSEAKSSNFIFRRSQLLEFITVPPSERYKAIGYLIGLADLDKYELEFIKTREYFQYQVTKLKEEISQHLKRIEDIFAVKIDNIDEILKYLNEFLNENGLETVNSISDVENVVKKIYIEDKYQKNKNFNDLYIKLSTIRDSLPDLIEFQRFEEKFFNIQQKYRDSIKQRRENIIKSMGIEDPDKIHDYIQFLNNSQEYIRNFQLNVCPLCNREISNELLLNSVSERISLFGELSKLGSDNRRNYQNLREYLEKITNCENKLLNFLKDFPDKQTNSEKRIEDDLLFLSEIINSLEKNNKLSIDIPVFQKITNIIRINIEDITQYGHLIEEEQKKTELSEEDKKKLSLIQSLSKIFDEWKEIEKKEKIKNNEFENPAKLAEIIADSFSKIKKQEVQVIYDQLKDKIQEFYSEIHPDDNHKNLDLSLDFRRRGSANISMDFYNRRNVDPRAFSSEGHLDTLGICIFLAFADIFIKNCPYLILDDVLTSIDIKHRYNIAKLILKNFQNKQLIITTHDDLWGEMLINMQQTYKIQDKFENLKIIGWSKNQGPFIKKILLRKEYIEKLVEQGELDATNNIRVYLEEILKIFCENFNVPIPYKNRNKYTIDDFFGPAQKLIKDKLTHCELKDNLLKCFEELSNLNMIFNVLSHDNTNFKTINEVKMFRDEAFKLEKLIKCPKCDGFIIYNRDKNMLNCANPNCIGFNIPTK